VIDLLRFLLVAFGLIYVITESVIFVHPRLWIALRGTTAEAFIYCAYCVGFWVGAALRLLEADAATVQQLLFDPVMGGCLVMGGVALVRACAPDVFLRGAWEREQTIIEALRKRAREKAAR